MQYQCLHIITRLANGGAEETLFDLILQLAERGIYCDIAVGRECALEVLAKFTLPEECHLYTIDHLVRNPKPIYEIKATREIRQLIRKNNYNIVQTHGSKAGILGRIAAHKEKVPAIIGTIHGIAFPPALGLLAKLLYKNLERYTAKMSHALVCVGEDMMQKYLNAKVGKKEQYSVIYTGMRLEQFSAVRKTSVKERIEVRKQFSLPTDLDITILGAISRLEDRKNQKALIRMLPEIRQQHKVHLCLIGDGPNHQRLLNYATELGVAQHVSFTGYLSRVWEVLPSIDIHCLVSLWEGLPRVLVQTSAAGIPNVCYEVDGAWEIVQDNISGFIVPHGNEKLYIEKLGELITDKDKRKQFGDAAAGFADTRWSLEKFGEDTLSLYRNLLS